MLIELVFTYKHTGIAILEEFLIITDTPLQYQGFTNSHPIRDVFLATDNFRTQTGNSLIELLKYFRGR